jgi:hypothetical protein
MDVDVDVDGYGWVLVVGRLLGECDLLGNVQKVCFGCSVAVIWAIFGASGGFWLQRNWRSTKYV